MKYWDFVGLMKTNDELSDICMMNAYESWHSDYSTVTKTVDKTIVRGDKKK